MKTFIAMLVLALVVSSLAAASVPIWDRYEIELESAADYENPLYEVREFGAEFTAPSGRKLRMQGFWDGSRSWKVRFMPDEAGAWSYRTFCSDEDNQGLHGIKGAFECTKSDSPLTLYQRGPLSLDQGSTHFRYRDGSPFFWQACTAWNGALKSTDEEWEHYLEQRASLGYNVIQLVATQWRGCAQNSEGEVAFSGSGRIAIHPAFFKRMDERISAVNRHGHVAAVVMLWALPFGPGRELSPGYYLPDQECILLARYIRARYQGHHVSWVLGGDGKYNEELEDRWKHIGRQVFRDGPRAPVTLHPHGRSWIGDVYGGEDWIDYIGYQSTHGTTRPHVDFINHTVGEGWKRIPACPVINMEPCYEEINNAIFAKGVRQASYWSVFAAPPAGITYGHDGTWPWLREGEKPENHRYTPEVQTWDKGIDLPGSRQVAYLGKLFRGLKWWELLPAQDLLLSQPGKEQFDHHVSVLKSEDHSNILVYSPVQQAVEILLPAGSYQARWYDPVSDHFEETGKLEGGLKHSLSPPFDVDAVLLLHR